MLLSVLNSKQNLITSIHSELSLVSMFLCYVVIKTSLGLDHFPTIFTAVLDTLEVLVNVLNNICLVSMLLANLSTHPA